MEWTTNLNWLAGCLPSTVVSLPQGHYIRMDVETQNLLPGLQDSRDKRHIRARHSPKNKTQGIR